MLKVAGANVQQVIGTACDDVGIGNFVQLRNRRDELVVPIVIALVYAHLHKGFDLVAQLGGVEQRMVAIYIAFLFQGFHPPQTRRWRQSHLVGQILVAQTPIGLQGAQNFQINLV